MWKSRIPRAGLDWQPLRAPSRIALISLADFSETAAI
jgi:hypothetical protein